MFYTHYPVPMVEPVRAQPLVLDMTDFSANPSGEAHLMSESRGAAGAPEPAAGLPAASGPGSPAEVDPVAVIRSKRYLSALILAAILGIPISAVAYGFLALVAKIQSYLFDDLPTHV